MAEFSRKGLHWFTLTPKELRLAAASEWFYCSECGEVKDPDGSPPWLHAKTPGTDGGPFGDIYLHNGCVTNYDNIDQGAPDAV